MKLRTLPFGYCYEQGCVIAHPTEEKVLKNIFQDYLSGDSLLAIANRLNARQVEFMPGIITWNKARVMRIIQDARYLGKTGYPALIDEETHTEAQKCKARKNNQRDIDRQADIYKLTTPILCSRCGRKMVRCCDNRLKTSVKWVCKAQDCHTAIGISDENLLGQVMERLNDVIVNPGIIQDSDVPVFEKSLDARKLENQIDRALDDGFQDTEALTQMMLQCISLKYECIPSERNTAKRLRVDFEATGPLAVFSAAFTNKVLTGIRLQEDGTVGIVLRNGQIIGRNVE